MGAIKLWNPRAAKTGQPLATASSGITWSGIDRPRTIEHKSGEIHRTRIIVPAFSFATTAAAKAIGQQIYQLPEGFILPLAANVRLVSTTGATTAATAGELGIGTSVASGATALLGTAAWANVLGPQTLSNHVAVTALTTQIAGAAGNTAGSMDVLNSTDSADPVELYLNIASTYSGTGGVTVSEAIVDLLWINLGDKI
jgi:hypothetical protein